MKKNQQKKKKQSPVIPGTLIMMNLISHNIIQMTQTEL